MSTESCAFMRMAAERRITISLSAEGWTAVNRLAMLERRTLSQMFDVLAIRALETLEAERQRRDAEDAGRERQ